MKKNKVISMILTVVMVFEILVIIVTLGFFWSEFSYEYTWHPDEDTMVYTLQEEQYGQLVKDYYINEFSNQRVTAGLRECYGVARYFEAALWYNAYDIVGDTQRSAVYAEKMEAAYDEMGDYQFLDAEIRKKLDME